MTPSRLILALLCLLQCADARAEAVIKQPSSVADIEIAAKLDSAELANKQRSFEGALINLESVIGSDLYRRLSPPIKLRVDEAYGWAAFRLSKSPAAHKAFLRATSNPQAGGADWFLLFQSAKLDNGFADAFHAFTTLSEKWPDFGQSLSDRDVTTAEQGFGTLPNAEEAQLAFEDYLEKSDWTPADPLFSRTVIWFHYAENLYETGDKEHAYVIAKRINDPDVIAIMRADRRFDALAASNPLQFDVHAAAEQRLTDFKSIAAKDTHALDAHVAVASKLLELGRFEEALATVNAALADAAQLTVEQRRRYYDLGPQYDHALLVKSFTLFGLGHQDEALGIATSIGAGLRMRHPNTDEALVIAEWLVDLGRGKEALEQLAPVANETLTFPGQGQLAMLRACAAAQTNDRAVLKENLDRLSQMKTYGPAWLLRALLCANDLAGAAAAVKASLDDPRVRPLMLQELQIYQQEKVRAPFAARIDARLTSLRGRADVLDAVNKVGRINRYDIVNLGPLY